MIDLIRVDTRGVHGQVMTQWVPKFNTKHIVFIDNKTARDDFMSEVIKMAIAQRKIRGVIYHVDKAVENQDKFSAQDSTMVVFQHIDNLYDAYKKGLKMPAVNIGTIGGGPGRKVVAPQVSLSEEEVQQLKEMNDNGVEIYFQTTPDYEKLSFADILAAYNK